MNGDVYAGQAHVIAHKPSPVRLDIPGERVRDLNQLIDYHDSQNGGRGQDPDESLIDAVIRVLIEQRERIDSLTKIKKESVTV